jgi:hypothetical protein
MNNKPSKPSDQDILSAWQAGLSEASKHSSLRQQLVQQQGELLPRFAAHYHNLIVMPRRMRRALQRRWKQSLAGLALLLAFGQTPALVAPIYVNARCSLAQAITAANNNSAVGGCAMGLGADTIVLPTSSTQTLAAVNNTARPWFICPATHCGRRVAILYGGEVFACRHCHKLAYQCQRESPDDRAKRRADKIRVRLGWEPDILNGEGFKPKGMHWRTYRRLTDEHDEWVAQAILVA